MGCREQYKCSACSYSVMTGAGKQMGMRSMQWTIRCYDCATLTDILVSRDPWDLPAGWTPTEYSCPKNETHRVALWSPDGGCPKCDGKMEVDRDGGVMMWD